MSLEIANRQDPLIIPTVSPTQEGTITPAMLAEFSAAGAPFAPAQALFVAKSWPVGSNPLIYFTTIQAALNQAATLNPSDVFSIAIEIFPGIYNENLTLVSHVNLFGAGRRATIINGTVTWLAGVGPNAPQIGTHEEIDIFHLRISNTLTTNSTAKTASVAVLNLNDVVLTANWSFVGRATSSDGCNVYSSLLEPASSGVFTDMNTFIFSTAVDGESEMVTVNGTSGNGLTMYGGQFLAPLSIAGTGSFVDFVGIEYYTAITVANSCVLYMAGSNFDFGSSVTVAAGGLADLRGSELGVPGVDITLTGPGPIDRNMVQLTSGSTSAGANAIVISPPLPNGTYNVSVTQTSAAGGTMPSITAKAGSGFTLGDAAGSRTFDLTVLRQ